MSNPHILNNDVQNRESLSDVRPARHRHWALRTPGKYLTTAYNKNPDPELHGPQDSARPPRPGQTAEQKARPGPPIPHEAGLRGGPPPPHPAPCEKPCRAPGLRGDKRWLPFLPPATERRASRAAHLPVSPRDRGTSRGTGSDHGQGVPAGASPSPRMTTALTGPAPAPLVICCSEPAPSGTSNHSALRVSVPKWPQTAQVPPCFLQEMKLRAEGLCGQSRLEPLFLEAQVSEEGVGWGDSLPCNPESTGGRRGKGERGERAREPSCSVPSPVLCPVPCPVPRPGRAHRPPPPPATA